MATASWHGYVCDAPCGRPKRKWWGLWNRGLMRLLVLGCFWPAPCFPNPVAVVTQHNDNARTGANLSETILTTNNVNTNQFGLILTRSVDDQIYAQPLVMTNVNIPGKGAHNLVIVATVNDSVYAFDADDPSVSSPYWQTSFLGPNIVAVAAADMTGACGGMYKDFSGRVGIVGTPVIDPGSGTIYLVVRTRCDQRELPSDTARHRDSDLLSLETVANEPAQAGYPNFQGER